MALANSYNGSYSFTERLSSFVKGVQEFRQRRRVFHQTLRELNALTSRELADLGLSRSMITRVAAEAAFGDK
ncbi:DUF1127 domain-containing protein [Frigidibacter oleivorans]|uniref:DUF1127 domain-containing protein n=1 Tax=Frigidibacter oleivorans TaxID=2487129 RepID=UPI000F8F3E23|nr:DUF1127 domain-containing protein [Frigidibacter oleivorans]